MSGTGNTRYCVEYLLRLLDETAEAVPIEEENAAERAAAHSSIVLAYPIQYSNAPLMVRAFIREHAELWRGKQVLCLATMGAFSGDGAGCAARILKRCGGAVTGGLHLRMPDSVCDSRLLKKPLEENRRIVKAAEKKMREAAARILAGDFPRDGLGLSCRIAGLLGQRLWFYGKTARYSDGPKFSGACVGCGLCEKVCPMRNLSIQNGRPLPRGRCTMCYRCISLCPRKAITLLGKEVTEQCRIESYLSNEKEDAE
nr:EFR1 family ferrodoxin [Anaerotruncus sp. DFI.9.16]